MKAISVENLSKSYRLGTIGTGTFFRDFERWFARMRGKPDPYARIGEADHGNRDGEEVWALRDVSFEVEQGEVLGIIGKNGAGKSTLLKILSRVTAPTTGQIKVRGRIASLLEVGTGFHPELTGRENIYLNGAILGMTREEVRRKFDEIVDFAGVETYIDTPVKRYSSGMYVRLAFAVAAHLEPEILIIDEVLAVGDAGFQKKCLGKMGEVAKGGRTVLFVSHDMTNISILCPRAILLDAGHLSTTGSASEVIAKYFQKYAYGTLSAEWDYSSAPGDDKVRVTRIAVQQLVHNTTSFYMSKPVVIEMHFCVLSEKIRINPVFVVKNATGMTVFSTSNYTESDWGDHSYEINPYTTKCTIPANFFNEGQYYVSGLIVQESRFVLINLENILSFVVHDDGSTRGGYIGPWTGITRPLCKWETHQL
ncbi:MAG: ABC transporter ATP-binding protein [Oscillochloridaceae bacterium umkhey_bin13]